MDWQLAQYLPLAVLGAVLGLDVVSFPQAMVSRPIVASTLAGALLGQPVRGLTMGVLLEFFALESLPFGASRYPEWGSAAVVGGSLFAAVPDGMAGAMLVSAFAALVTASLGSSSMVFLRRWNAIWARGQQRRIARGSGSAVVALQLAGLSADLIRGGALTLVALVVFAPLHFAIVGTFTMSPVVSRAVVVSVASAVGLAAIWKVVRTTKGARWWLAFGIGAGFVIAGSL
ncbi:MAG: PTS sugar transporter subunit IIC [Gemmatimonadota bacterium]|nr:PTS sugar transporter subunit IIC [Gemmatimonadota bacterium]